MYSIVMLTAMSVGSDVTPPPAAGAPHAVVSTGCNGCSGFVVSGCHGSCYGSCYGSGCHGGAFRRGGGFLGHRSSCHGCTGYSCSGYNCFSSGWSCSGCHGWSHGASCHGSCYGYNPWAFPGAACHGGALVVYAGPPVGMPPYTLTGYNYSVVPVWYPGAPVAGSLTDSHAVYGRVTNPNLPPAMTVPVEPMKKPAGTDDKPMGANLKFTVPADTKLYVDGRLAAGTGPERAFYTPPLEAGKKFFYEVKAELVVDGKTVVDEKRVIVEAGATVTESFAKLTAAVEKAASVAGK